MINGIHTLIYVNDADAARAFFRDVLDLPAVDAGHGWLIFGLPPAELGVHPAGNESDAPAEMAGRHQLYLMCDDVNATVAELSAKGVEFTRPVSDQGWGLVTTLKVPGGGELSLYEPRHSTAIKAASAAPRRAKRAPVPSRQAARKKTKTKATKKKAARAASARGQTSARRRRGR